MKFAITGKGGVGKTTICALLAKTLAARGKQVFAIDADPNTNLAACLGVPNADDIRPLVELKDLIEERTGAKPGAIGGMFRLNPFVADLPEAYAVEAGGVKVLVAGTVKRGGAGCYCPENALVRALIAHLVNDPDTALVLDMEAGIEHLSRGTVRAVDSLLTVVGPSRRSTETAERIERLASDIGLARIAVVGNKVHEPDDETTIRNLLPGRDFAGFFPYDDEVRRAEVAGRSVWGVSAAMEKTATQIVEKLERHAPA